MELPLKECGTLFNFKPFLHFLNSIGGRVFLEFIDSLSVYL